MMSDIDLSLTVIEKPCSCEGGSLDRLVQPACLVALAAEPLHGYLIADRLAAWPLFGGERPDVSGIYRTLKAMESQGLVESDWDTSESGPARKQYRLTDSGRHCLRQWIVTLDDYHRGVGALLASAREACSQDSTPAEAALLVQTPPTSPAS